MGLAARARAVLTFPGRQAAAGSQEGIVMGKSVYDETYARSMRDPEGFWAAAAEDIHWDKPLGPSPRRLAPAVLSLVRGRRAQHLLQRARPAHRARPRQAARARLRQPRHRHGADVHLLRAPRRGRALRGRAPAPGRREGRPRDHLHADGARGRDRDARVRAPRRDPLGGLRRLRRQRAGQAHRRCQAEG